MAMRKYTLRVDGAITSLSAEEEFWDALKAIAADKEVTVTALVNEINSARQSPNLSAAVRIFVINYFMERSCGYL